MAKGTARTPSSSAAVSAELIDWVGVVRGDEVICSTLPSDAGNESLTVKTVLSAPLSTGWRATPSQTAAAEPEVV